MGIFPRGIFLFLKIFPGLFAEGRASFFPSARDSVFPAGGAAFFPARVADAFSGFRLPLYGFFIRIFLRRRAGLF